MAQILDAFDWLWKWLVNTNPDAWSAIANWTTAAIAVVASLAAFRQVREARNLREEQAQPYVVAYMEPSAASEHVIDVVVKNFGTTVARDVRMKSLPTMQRTDGKGGIKDVRIFECLPLLVPGQEWRTFWDFSPERSKVDLPKRHEVDVTYRDSQGRELPATHAILDWSMYSGRQWIVTYSQHDAAEALKEISKTMGKWSEFGHGLAVFSRDGDEKDNRRRETMEEQRERREALVSRLIGLNGGISSSREDAAGVASGELGDEVEPLLPEGADDKVEKTNGSGK